MKKNQERRLHRKNAKIAIEGGTPLTLKRPMKPDTTVRWRLGLGTPSVANPCFRVYRGVVDIAGRWVT